MKNSVPVAHIKEEPIAQRGDALHYLGKVTRLGKPSTKLEIPDFLDAAITSHRNTFPKKDIRQRQRSEWRIFCEDIQSTAAAARLRMSKDHMLEPYIEYLKKDYCSYAANLSESLGI